MIELIVSFSSDDELVGSKRHLWWEHKYFSGVPTLLFLSDIVCLSTTLSFWSAGCEHFDWNLYLTNPLQFLYKP